MTIDSYNPALHTCHTCERPVPLGEGWWAEGAGQTGWSGCTSCYEWRNELRRQGVQIEPIGLTTNGSKYQEIWHFGPHINTKKMHAILDELERRKRTWQLALPDIPVKSAENCTTALQETVLEGKEQAKPKTEHNTAQKEDWKGKRMGKIKFLDGKPFGEIDDTDDDDYEVRSAGFDIMEGGNNPAGSCRIAIKTNRRKPQNNELAFAFVANRNTLGFSTPLTGELRGDVANAFAELMAAASDYLGSSARRRRGDSSHSGDSSDDNYHDNDEQNYQDNS